MVGRAVTILRSLSAYRRALSAFAEIDPFERTELPGQLFHVALRQQRRASEPHCGTLDRLHLAAMEWLGLSRLLTHDHRKRRQFLNRGLCNVNNSLSKHLAEWRFQSPADLRSFVTKPSAIFAVKL